LKQGVLPETISTSHGSVSLVRATLRLLEEAFKDPENTYFLLLSESCIPIMPFNYIYDFLVSSGKSFIGYSHVSGVETEKRWSHLKDSGFLPWEKFYKQHQWMVLHRDAVEVLLREDFTEMYEDMFAVDEHYFIQTLMKQGFPVEERVIAQPLTFVNWRDIELRETLVNDPIKGKIYIGIYRPNTYRIITNADLAIAIELGNLFFRKVAIDCVWKT
jgi:hypothetical protein